MVNLNIFILYVNCYLTNSALVKWVPNTSFDLPLNFNNGKLPCGKETLVFADSLDSAVIMKSDSSVSEIVLPLNGELIMAENGVLNFGPTGKEDLTCISQNVYFLEKSTASWAEPDVWSSEKFNEATPDAERVPCFDDIVEFPTSAQFTIKLPNRIQYVQEIRLKDKRVDEAQFKEEARRSGQIQQFILNEGLDTGVKLVNLKCPWKQGCLCQTTPLKIECATKRCDVPKCTDPVSPVGNCCPICGGTVTIDTDETFDLMSLKYTVEKTLDSSDQLVYHVGKLSSHTVQVVIVEHGQYTGASAEVAARLARLLGAREVQTSGGVGAGGRTGSRVAELVVGALGAVLAALGAVYVRYYGMRGWTPWEGWAGLAGSQWARRGVRSDSVVSLARRDSSASSQSYGASPVAFRNPLYDSKRERVQVTEKEPEHNE